MAATSRAGLILEAGLRAAAKGDGAALRQAADSLDRIGAHAADGTDDLATEWRRQAAHLGVTTAAAPWRGRTLGPAYRKGQIAAHSSFTTRQTFNAGQKAEVSVVVLNSQALNLSVSDETQTEACRLNLSRGGAASCDWVPVWTSGYTIHLENDADTEIAFYLLTN